jgi:hypothetical protein
MRKDTVGFHHHKNDMAPVLEHQYISLLLRRNFLRAVLLGPLSHRHRYQFWAIVQSQLEWIAALSGYPLERPQPRAPRVS